MSVRHARRTPPRRSSWFRSVPLLAAAVVVGGVTGVSRSKTETITNPWQYTGGQLDAATGLYHLQARYYDPSIGRFTQPDPTGQDANPFAYAMGNPITRTDPTGTVSIPWRKIFSKLTSKSVWRRGIASSAKKAPLVCLLYQDLKKGDVDEWHDDVHDFVGCFDPIGWAPYESYSK